MSEPAVQPMTERTREPEMMDDLQADPNELRASLRFLRWLNRWAGSVSFVLEELDRIAQGLEPGQPVRVLDIGTGGGDLPVAVLRWGRRQRIPVRITAVDNHPQTLSQARAHLARHHVPPAADADRQSEEDPAVQLLEMDARDIESKFPSGAFDLANAGLFLHHLADEDIVPVLRSMGRVAGTVVWDDLLRNRIGRLGARGLTLFQPRMVRHDAIVSVNAGFTGQEVDRLVDLAGLAVRRQRNIYGYRFVLAAGSRTG